MASVRVSMVVSVILVLAAAFWAPLLSLSVPRTGWSRLFLSTGFSFVGHVVQRAIPDMCGHCSFQICRVAGASSGAPGAESAPPSQQAYSRAALQALSPFLLWNALSNIETKARRIELKWGDEKRYILSNIEARARTKGLKVEELDDSLKARWTKEFRSRYSKQAPQRLKEAETLRQELATKRAELEAVQSGARGNDRVPETQAQAQSSPSVESPLQSGRGEPVIASRGTVPLLLSSSCYGPVSRQVLPDPVSECTPASARSGCILLLTPSATSAISR